MKAFVKQVFAKTFDLPGFLLFFAVALTLIFLLVVLISVVRGDYEAIPTYGGVVGVVYLVCLITCIGKAIAENIEFKKRRREFAHWFFKFEEEFDFFLGDEKAKGQIQPVHDEANALLTTLEAWQRGRIKKDKSDLNFEMAMMTSRMETSCWIMNPRAQARAR